jgi:predicted nucleic acid-binding protein
MSDFILDTNVLSNIIKRALPNFALWLDQNCGRCFVSVASLHEIHYGLELYAASPHPEKRYQGRRLEGLYQILFQFFPGRFLPNTPVLAVFSGKLRARATHRRGDVGVVDAVIAATAIEHNLTVISANASTFIAMGVPVIDPGELQPLADTAASEAGLILIRGGADQARTHEQGSLPLWPNKRKRS